MKQKRMSGKQSIAISLVFLFAIIILISNVSASYKWACLKNGDSVPSKTNPRFTCSHDLCMMCVDSKNYPTNFGYCSKSAPCGTNGNGSDDTTPPVLTINSPVDNNVYSTRQVLFDLKTNELATFYYIDNINGRGQWKTIAQSPTQTVKTSISFSDGLNDITIKAVDKSGNPTTIAKKFYVDSKAPQIKSTTPSKGFADGNFAIQFTEQNPKTLTLFYGNSANGQKNTTLDLSQCSTNKGVNICSKKVDLSIYNNQQISYYFIVEDIAGSKAQSKSLSLSVDNVAPVINNPTKMVRTDSRYAYFNISVTEKNFKEIDYIDNSALKPKYVKLCSSLKNGWCVAKASLSKGSHDVDVKVIDNAGNSLVKSLVITIA